MAFRQYRTFLLIAIAVLALFIATPALTKLFVAPQATYYTELSILGPSHNTTYPSAISPSTPYTFYLNVENHLGSPGDYVIEVKFRNVNGSAPDSFTKTSSSLPSLYDLKVFVEDSKAVETKIIVSFSYSGAYVTSLTINGYTAPVATSLVKDSTGTFGNLFFELWLYNETAKAYQYNDRYVSLWFNFK